ncbi:hypothetical protein AAK899_01025 [Erysipelotrichaceae bacterium 51-3]|uniref:hypothetical protein n=1 Tax=Allobaculum sp. JKK-2023 TaxID=3108943 RepID=UPI002B05E029|nr:hypothetical protein [Allobaculum sp. JKK-2023]
MNQKSILYSTYSSEKVVCLHLFQRYILFLARKRALPGDPVVFNLKALDFSLPPLILPTHKRFDSSILLVFTSDFGVTEKLEKKNPLFQQSAGDSVQSRSTCFHISCGS